MGEWDGLRIGYDPLSEDLRAPGDRRRMGLWARARGVKLLRPEPGGVYDVVVVSSTADITQWARQPDHTRVVYDLIDSYLALPRRSPRQLLRGAAKFASRETRHLALDYTAAIERMCHRSDAVICTTQEQQADLRRLNPNVHIILDAHGELTTPPKSSYALEGRALHLVWEGLPQTVGPLRQLTPVLDELGRDWDVHLHLVTDPRFHQFAGHFVRRSTIDLVRSIHPNVELHPWDLSTLGQIITGADIAVIPLDLGDPFSRGKPENKLLIFWRLGMPTITSASPAYDRAMKAAGTDLLCASTAEWLAALDRLARDEAARADAGTRGLAYVAANHSDEQVLARWDTAMRSVLR